MPARKYLTDAEARTMTRGQLVDRIYDEMQKWLVRPPRTDGQVAAYRETMRIMRGYVDAVDGMTDTLNLLKTGRSDGYWDTPVASLPPLQPPG